MVPDNKNRLVKARDDLQNVLVRYPIFINKTMFEEYPKLLNNGENKDTFQIHIDLI